MIKIAICDVNENDRAKIKKYCQDYFKKGILKYELQEFTSGESLLKADFPDILLLETDIGKISGLLVKEILELKRAETRILFISSEVNKMALAFGKNVYGFLLKPLQYECFAKGMAQMIEDIEEMRNYVFCKNQEKFEKILFRDIVYIESYGRYTKIYVRGDTDYRLSDKCIGDWCEDLEYLDFFNCHRCYLVNLSYVKRIHKCVELEDGRRVPSSEDKRKIFREIYKGFIWRKSYGKNDERVLQESGEEFV